MDNIIFVNIPSTVVQFVMFMLIGVAAFSCFTTLLHSTHPCFFPQVRGLSTAYILMLFCNKVTCMLITDFMNIFCLNCECNNIKAMSVVPQGAFAARKIRQNEDKMKKGYQTNDCIGELAPQKYSSKFMNSIWGMYNRYSVHNLKKNFDAAAMSSNTPVTKEFNKTSTVTTSGTFLSLLGHL